MAIVRRSTSTRFRGKRSDNQFQLPSAGFGKKTFGWVSAFSGTRVVPRLLQEVSERFQRRFGNVMLDALGIRLGDLGGDTQRDKKIDDDPVTRSRSLGQRSSGVGEKDAAIGQSRGQPLSLSET
jgi:hypothetical protein